jgi:copper oxidase (laccase) domain-containing protein
MVQPRVTDEVVSALAERMDPRNRSWFETCDLAGLPVLRARLPGPFRVVFTTRHGGRSGGPFAYLNLDERTGQDPAARYNRSLLARTIGRRLVSPAQAHGLRVVGAAEYDAAYPQTSCDGLTIHPLLDRGLAATLLFADCLPLVLYGEVDLAVVHAGWRGLLGGIVQRAGLAMVGPPAGVVVGPSIGPCCFVVGREVAEAFAARFGAEVVRSTPKDGAGSDSVWRVDLWAAVERAAEDLGIPARLVHNPRLCTVCNRDLFYSYRAEGPVTGRHGCVAWAEE